jgi:hypothetical protein
VQIVAEVTGECGFGGLQAVMDRPGDHEITASESYRGHRLPSSADAHPNAK